jgi:glyoxylase-like metal-dependent hydrolase (beta-lactamase superfamily II)
LTKPERKVQGNPLIEKMESAIERISPFLALIRIPYLCSGGNAAFVNHFLIIDKELILIDTGPWKSNYVDGLSSCLARLGLSIKDVSKIVYTHPHPDHMGGGIQLKGEVESSHLIYWKARERVEQYGEYIELMKSLCKGTFLKHLNQHPAEWECYSKIVDKFWYPTFGEISFDHELHDGEIITSGNLRLEVIFTPGHSPWDISLWEADHGLLFTGDSLMQKMTTLIGGLGGLGSDLNSYGSSLKKLEKYLEKARWVLPSHGAPIGSPSSLAKNFLEMIKKREDRIIQELSAKECSLVDLQRVFGASKDPVVFVRRLGVVLSHMEKLEREERIVQLKKDNGEIVFMLK